MKKSLLCFVFVICSYVIQSQDFNYSSILIPQELTENANAVVRDYTLDITIEAVDKMLVHKRKVITVLNKMGDKRIDLYEFYDNDIKISKLSATIYNYAGEEIKHLKTKDFEDASAISNGTLYSDSRVKYAEYTPISYPYTVVFDSFYRTSTTGFIPTWNPIDAFALSVQKAKLIIKNPTAIPWRHKNTNFKGYNIEFNKTDTEITATATHLKAIEFERNSVSFDKIFPFVLISLNKFCLKETCGEANNWKEFGKWRYDYLKNGNDELSEEIQEKALSLVKGVNDPVEKAKIIYNYVQNKTRYISVQEGIGGWKPIPANEVDKVGYGDCKGLTNYTKALLDVVGVKSHYSVVWAGEKKDVKKDFFGMQGNHIILNIPNNGNDIWLECTSQTIPFGFLGDFTDDRDVLVITEEGGVIKHTTSYDHEDNYQKTEADIVLDANANLTATLKRTSKGLQFDDKSYYNRLPKEDLDKEYVEKVWDYNNNLTINSANLKVDKENVVLEEDVNIAIESYAVKSQQDYLFYVNPFNRYNYIPKRYRNRKLPLEISMGFKDEDIYHFTLPKGYVIEVLPPEKIIENKFGTYKVTFTKIDNTHFTYKRTLVIKENTYPKEDYKAYRSFIRSITKYDNTRIAINQKS